jgi:hypothetical protein
MNLGEQAIVDAEMPPNAGLLTPAQRREIEIWFAQALDASSERRREYAKADELFGRCLARDGGNVLVVRAYLENLARWRGRAGKSTWRGWWELRGLLKSDAGAEARYVAAINLFSREASLRVLRVLAGACRELGWELAEEAYLRDTLFIDEPDAHERLAEICVARGDFQCARAHFGHAVKFPLFYEVEACLQAVHEADAGQEPEAGDADPLAVARGHVAANRFAAAAAVLARAEALSGHSLAIREAREDLPLARIGFEIEALAGLEKSGNALAARARGSLRQKLARMELDLAGVRAARYPADWALRLALVEQLIRTGNYFEALRRLRESPAAVGVERARALRLVAETQQRLRRFEEAIAAYRELLASGEFGSLGAAEQERVRGQYERLAGAMGQT